MVSELESIRMDPVTFQVLRNAFRAICTEASAMIERAAYAPTITEGHDYSVSVLTKDARLIAHGHRDQSPHMGTFESSIKAVIDDVDDIKEGDVFIFNDPYSGGTHQNDVKIIRPIFIDSKLFAFTIQLCHWPDAGGPMPGTFNPRATECYAEGLRMPPLRLFEHDKLVKSTYNLIRMNVRCATERLAEIHAQYHAGRLVERRLKEYVDKFGKDTIELAFEETMNYSERLFRNWIGRLPDGVYEFTDYGDRDIMAPGEPRIKVHCKMTIAGDTVTLDWSGSDPAPVSSWGFARPALLSATYDGTMHCFHDLAPLNHGIIRCLNIVTKPGTCVDVQEPTPVTGYCSGAYEKADAVTMACWAQALVNVDPSRIYCATVNLQNVCTGGLHPKTGAQFVSYLWLEGGQGARTYKDGNSFYMMIFISGASNQSMEVLERWYPMIHTSCEAVQDSCGDGKFRGGVGMARNFRVWGETKLTVHGDREEVTPHGLAGGTNGGPNRLLVNVRTPKEENLGMFAAGKVLLPGDHVTFESNGGGGYGNPLERNPEAVLEDVIDELVSLRKAREIYGVAIRAIDPEALQYEIDWDETTRLQGVLAKRELPVGFGFGEVHPLGAKIVPGVSIGS